MKKEWETPEICFLNVKKTDHMYNGEGRDNYTISQVDPPIYGTSTGLQDLYDWPEINLEP